MGHVRFFVQAERAVEEANFALDWSDLEWLRELSKLSSERPTKLAVESDVTLVHDLHDRPVMFEQFSGCRWAAPPNPCIATQPTGAIDLTPPGDQLKPATDLRAHEGKSCPASRSFHPNNLNSRHQSFAGQRR